MKHALVVKRDTLFQDKYFQGFMPISEANFIEIIKKGHSYSPRSDELENNASLQQIIPYIWIVNPITKKIFLYKRTENKKQDNEYKEKRYLNKYSGGVGGHIDKETEENSEDPITASMMRELQEEVEMIKYPNPKVIGYINDDEEPIGKVHFGVVAIAETTESVKCQESEGLSSGKFYSIEEVEDIFAGKENNIENWTKISWPAIKDYLMKE